MGGVCGVVFGCVASRSTCIMFHPTALRAVRAPRVPPVNRIVTPVRARRQRVCDKCAAPGHTQAPADARANHRRDAACGGRCCCLRTCTHPSIHLLSAGTAAPAQRSGGGKSATGVACRCGNTIYITRSPAFAINPMRLLLLLLLHFAFRPEWVCAAGAGARYAVETPPPMLCVRSLARCQLIR